LVSLVSVELKTNSVMFPVDVLPLSTDAVFSPLLLVCFFVRGFVKTLPMNFGEFAVKYCELG